MDNLTILNIAGGIIFVILFTGIFLHKKYVGKTTSNLVILDKSGHSDTSEWEDPFIPDLDGFGEK